MSESLKFSPVITDSTKLSNMEIHAGQFIINIDDGSSYLDFTIDNTDTRIPLSSPLEIASADTLGGVKIGQGIAIASDGTISVDTYDLQPATSETLGGVKIGSGISVTSDGTISVQAYSLPTASSDTLGGIKVGSRLSIDANGVLSANDQSYTLPTASADTLGGVKIGQGININNGVISAQSYSLPTASANTLGGVKVGSRLSIDANGVLSADNQSYTLPTADANTLGGIKIGSGLSITNGVASVSATVATEASHSSITDTGNYFTSTDVEGALQELGAQLSGVQGLLEAI